MATHTTQQQQKTRSKEKKFLEILTLFSTWENSYKECLRLDWKFYVKKYYCVKYYHQIQKIDIKKIVTTHTIDNNTNELVERLYINGTIIGCKEITTCYDK